MPLRSLLVTCAVFLAACQGAGENSSNENNPDNPDVASAKLGSVLVACLQDSDCASGSYCAQFNDDSYCAADCSNSTCPSRDACTEENTQAGESVLVCIPSSIQPATATDCSAYDPPDTPSDCKSCTPGSSGCQANGCSSGKDCHNTTKRCVIPPKGCGGSSSGGSSSGSGGSTGSSTGSATGTGSVGPSGGTLQNLSFAIAGDTRPPSPGDTKGYPTAVITQIYQDIQAAAPGFVVTTGDHAYDDSAADGAAFGPQLDLYLQARALYSGTVFFTMGNHECNGHTTSNCGSGNADGLTGAYTQFKNKLLSSIGQSNPYYSINVAATDGSWTAKLVFVAANFWSSTQQTWLQNTLAQPTTYTFVMRHEQVSASTAPGVTPSQTIINQYPLTTLIVGHAHTLESKTANKEIIVGNGGAPLTTGSNYGYVIASRRASDGAIVFNGYDYQSGAVLLTVAYLADGTLTK